FKGQSTSRRREKGAGPRFRAPSATIHCKWSRNGDRHLFRMTTSGAARPVEKGASPHFLHPSHFSLPMNSRQLQKLGVPEWCVPAAIAAVQAASADKSIDNKSIKR